MATQAPDPKRWPAMVAAHMTRIREILDGPDKTVDQSALFNQLLEEAGLPLNNREVSQLGRDAELVAGELEYTLWEAFRRLVAAGEIHSWTGGSSLKFARYLPDHFGWELPDNPFQYQQGGTYSLTIRGLERIQGAWEAAGTRWPNVDALQEEAGDAMRQGLSVAAAVTARVTVEEAVRAALDDLAIVYKPRSRAWEREKQLFGSLSKAASAFQPLDFSATSAAASVIRSVGNRVAHDGHVSDPQLAFTVLLLLPRAATSLSAAVGAATSAIR